MPFPDAVRAIAWKAQTRLCQRYRQMLARGKLKPVIVTAIARELAGFVWRIACITSDSPATGAALAASAPQACHDGSMAPDRARQARPPLKGAPRRAQSGHRRDDQRNAQASVMT